MAARLLSWPDTERVNTRELDFLGRVFSIEALLKTSRLSLDFGHV